jgi:hypothetical protein
MYASIRRDEGAASAIEEEVGASRGLMAALDGIPGFISCAVLDAGDGALLSIGICEDPASLEDVNRLLAGWLAAHPTTPPRRPPRITTGEIIFQKGL